MKHRITSEITDSSLAQTLIDNFNKVDQTNYDRPENFEGHLKYQFVLGMRYIEIKEMPSREHLTKKERAKKKLNYIPEGKGSGLKAEEAMLDSSELLDMSSISSTKTLDEGGKASKISFKVEEPETNYYEVPLPSDSHHPVIEEDSDVLSLLSKLF